MESINRRRVLLAIIFVVSLLPAITQAGQYSLKEKDDQSKIYSIQVNMKAEGTLQSASTDGKTFDMPLKVDANMKYRELRITGTGRDALALRSLRYYEKGEVAIDVANQKSFSQLPAEKRLLVAQGQREGVLFYSPTKQMEVNELELLTVPGDSLGIAGLLPAKKVDIGETWTPESWVLQMLTSTEAVSKIEMTCTLEGITNGNARVICQGKVVGATDGSNVNSTVSGYYLFSIADQHISTVNLKVEEKRSVGTVSPGMDVTANVNLTRSPITNATFLTEQITQSVPLEPEKKQLLVTFRPPWNTQITLDRKWKVFHQNRNVAVLRLVDSGRFIAQCNVSYLPTVAPGQHTSEKQFQRDIRTALGDKLGEITSAELVKTDDARFLYRVSAIGKANEIEMQWNYYLCANSDGRQTAFVFAMEKKLVKELGNRDLEIVNSLLFLTPAKVPRTASP